MTKRSLFLAASVGIILLFTATNIIATVFETQRKTPIVTKVAVQPPTIDELLRLVNAERAKNGVAPLTIDVRLNQSAQMKADDEIKYNYFGHVSPVTNTRNGLDAIKATGIECVWESENLVSIISGEPSSRAAVRDWINSPPHHAAMIDPKYSLTGFGIHGTQVVEHFCQQ